MQKFYASSFYIKFGKYTSITMQKKKKTSQDGKHVYGIFI